MAWYDIVLLSYPGQAGTDHLMLLPGAAEEQNGETAETSALLRPPIPSERFRMGLSCLSCWRATWCSR